MDWEVRPQHQNTRERMSQHRPLIETNMLHVSLPLHHFRSMPINLKSLGQMNKIMRSIWSPRKLAAQAWQPNQFSCQWFQWESCLKSIPYPISQAKATSSTLCWLHADERSWSFQCLESPKTLWWSSRCVYSNLELKGVLLHRHGNFLCDFPTPINSPSKVSAQAWQCRRVIF